MEPANLVRRSATYVKQLLTTQLPADMHFHNLQHTQHVVNAATEIGFQCAVSKADMAIVQTAAWFHDTGYCYAYTGHEENSIAIAATFLRQQNCEPAFINEVTGCIEATRMPQLPKNILQKIMCDADMFHLAEDDYPNYSARLKAEWEFKINKSYSDNEWCTLNLNMLAGHSYFTKFGKTVLEAYKQYNIDTLAGSLAK